MARAKQPFAAAVKSGIYEASFDMPCMACRQLRGRWRSGRQLGRTPHQSQLLTSAQMEPIWAQDPPRVSTPHPMPEAQLCGLVCMQHGLQVASHALSASVQASQGWASAWHGA